MHSPQQLQWWIIITKKKLNWGGGGGGGGSGEKEIQTELSTATVRMTITPSR